MTNLVIKVLEMPLATHTGSERQERDALLMYISACTSFLHCLLNCPTDWHREEISNNSWVVVQKSSLRK